MASTPYFIGSNTGLGTSLVVNVGTAMNPGDGIAIAGSNSNGIVTGITDTQNNSYGPVASHGADQKCSLWVAVGPSVTPLGLSDSMTLQYSVSGDLAAIVSDVPGVQAQDSLSTAVSYATAAQPSAALTCTSGSLAEAQEPVLVVMMDGAGGGVPTSVTSGYVELGTAQYTGSGGSTGPHLTMYYISPTGAAAQSVSASIVASGSWTVLMSGLKSSAGASGPYFIGSNTETTGTTLTVPVETPTNPGDGVVIACGSNAGAVTSVADSQGNGYRQLEANPTGTKTSLWAALGNQVKVLSTTDTFAVQYTVTGKQSAIAGGVPGINNADASSAAVATGTSASPAVTSGPVTVAGEPVIMVLETGAGGGTPSGLGAFTSLGTVSASGAAKLTLAWGTAGSAGSTMTGGATISSDVWAGLICGLDSTTTVLQSAVGAQTANQFQVVSGLANATSVRLKVGTNLALTTGVQYIAAQTPDALGCVRHLVPNLTPSTQYYYQLLNTPAGGTESAIGPVGMSKTLPPSGTPQSFRVALVSCVTNNAEDTHGFNDWVNWNADLCIYTGDQSYADTTSTSLAAQVGVYQAQTAGSGVGDPVAAAAGYGSSYSMMHGQSWGYYCRSDHEAGPDNGDSGPPSAVPYIPVNIAAALEVYPWGTLGDTVNVPVHGLYQSWTIGRVRFILIDIRNIDRSPGATTDGPGKTMLGAQQLAWFYNELLQPEPLKIVIGDTQWGGAPSTYLVTNGQDKWWSYNYERQAICNFVAANQARVGHVMWWHGDCHALATYTAADNTYGNWPVYCAAPLHNQGGGLDVTAFSQAWNNSGGPVRGYGRITITDDGSTITSQFIGWDAVAQVTRIEQTDVFSCPPVIPARGGLLA